MEDQEIVTEFLIESSENLSRLDQEMVELEKHPGDAERLASVFRTIHTIKGTCGFLGFSNLEAITHHAENLLSLLRAGELVLTPLRVSLILKTVDATRRELLSIERGGCESGEQYPELRERLRAAAAKDAAPMEQPPAEDDSAGLLIEPLAALAASAVSSRGPAAADSTIRVDVCLLDKLMNLVGELVLARNQILQASARQEYGQIGPASQRLNLIASQLQEGVMKTRMQPIGVVWSKLPRVVRDLASSCGKQIRIEMDGAGTELDKSIIEAIKDPLTHIVRNCCDHGIERPEVRAGRGKPAEGVLQLRAFHEGGQVNIEIADDGGGVDPAKVKAKAVSKGLLRPEQADAMPDREAVNLLFLPGFSTAEQVTNISGRGVGMDVVKTNIERIGGSVDLLSRMGEGTTVRLKIPLTLAIVPGLVVRSGEQRFVIPQVNLLELLRLEGDGLKQIEHIHGTPVYRRRGTLLPLGYLNRILRLPEAASGRAKEVLNIVVLQAEDRQFGLVVDAVNDTQEIVVKPLGKQLKGMTCYAGATIMGDGRVALILDVGGLAAQSGVLGEGQRAGRSTAAAEASAVERQSLLLIRSGSYQRLAVPVALVARLEEFPPERIERSDGRAAIQYRGQILPLVVLAPLLDPRASDVIETGSPVPVVVFGDGDKAIGLVVDEILDLVETEVAVRRPSSSSMLFGSAVVNGKVTDFLDLPTVMGARADQAGSGSEGSRKSRWVLLATEAGVSRGMARAYLEMAGHRVREAASAAEAIKLAAARRYDAVFASQDLAGTPVGGGAAELVRRLRAISAYAEVPIIGLAGEHGSPLGEEHGFDAWQTGLDRDSVLASLERLAGSVGSAQPDGQPIEAGAHSLKEGRS